MQLRRLLPGGFSLKAIPLLVLLDLLGQQVRRRDHPEADFPAPLHHFFP